MDNRSPRQRVREYIGNARLHVGIERTKRIVDQDPRRRLQEDAREHERHLLVLTEFALPALGHIEQRSEEHTSELQSLMRISYAVFCLKKKNTKTQTA